VQRLREPDPACSGIRGIDRPIGGAFFAKQLQRAAVGGRQHLIAEKARDRSAVIIGQGMILVEIIIRSPPWELDFCGAVGVPYLQRNSAWSGGGIFGGLTENPLPAITLTCTRALIRAIEVDCHDSAACADGCLRRAGDQAPVVFHQDRHHPEVNPGIFEGQRAAPVDVHVAIAIGAHSHRTWPSDLQILAVPRRQ
jgi:hypothetical protein